jgi:hyaluronoglucosaminidase
VHDQPKFRRILRNEADYGKQTLPDLPLYARLRAMKSTIGFAHRGVVEGFFGPPWSMAQRRALFELGGARGMNTYVYAPKDDPYHRKLWRRSYPRSEWHKLLRLIQAAHKQRIDFVYAFHPGHGLQFSAEPPIRMLLAKAQAFYDAGVKTFAVLFDDIPSRLQHEKDRRSFSNSLAAAEALWTNRIIAAQPSSWSDVDWWFCPSYYSEDPLLERVFGRFEPEFIETLARHLAPDVACFWTGPYVVCEKIRASDIRRVARVLKRRLLLWDNYPVNDLSMKDELHIGPLQRRDPALLQNLAGYLNNPMLQPDLSLLPLATCFDYAAAPETYDPEKSWVRAVTERFGTRALRHWRAIRRFCDSHVASKKRGVRIRVSGRERRALGAAIAYVDLHRREPWAREIQPWRKVIVSALADSPS